MPKTATSITFVGNSYYFCNKIYTDKKQADKQASLIRKNQNWQETLHLVNSSTGRLVNLNMFLWYSNMTI